MTSSGRKQRLVDIEENPSRKLSPIQGYANETVVSLEEAVKPLVGLVHNVENMAAWAKWTCHVSPADGLTIDESASIILYSMQWDPSDRCLFMVLNRMLRDENRNRLKPWFRYLKLFLTALGRLPSTTKTIFRGVKLDLRKTYQTEKNIIWWGFSSCTCTMDVLNNDQFLGSTGPRTFFTIECSTGKDIRNHSAFSDEDEILLPAARYFQVMSCLLQGDDLCLVHLKEMKSPVRLIELIPEVSLASSDPEPQSNRSNYPGANHLEVSNNLKRSLLVTSYSLRWEQRGVTIAGDRNGSEGKGKHQLNHPIGLYVDESQTLYIADLGNHRIVSWKAEASSGQVLAGSQRPGDRLDELNYPTNVIMDRETESLLICDRNNRRVIRWSLRCSGHHGEIFTDNIDCWGIAIDKHGSVYVSDYKKHEVRRYDKGGDRRGIVVAGGHDCGSNLNQFNWPSYLFIDAQLNLYVSDWNNHRVMKWLRGASEGILVAGGNGHGNDQTQLSNPKGVWADENGNVYVVDSDNNRVMLWTNRANEGMVIVGGNGEGNKPSQLNSPRGLFFDHSANLYVADYNNHRVQRFSVVQ